MFHKISFKLFPVVAVVLVHQPLWAALSDSSAIPVLNLPQQQDEFIREQQRQDQFQQQMQPNVDVRLDESVVQKPILTLPQNEQPCFVINQIHLTGDSAHLFQFALNRAIALSEFQPGMCLGALGINQLMTLAQNSVIDRGYTTTRILAESQDLKTGKLVLTVVPGRINEILYDLNNRDQTHVGRIRSFNNKFPTESGAILNLRDLEQGLENLKRVPTAEANMQIVPADAPNKSDVLVTWSQRIIPVRLTLNADDSGSTSTGRYQGGTTVSLDNPMGLSDLFYINYNQDLGGKKRYVDREDQTTDSSTRGYAVHYSVPVGNWLWSVNHNYYRYHQAVPGYSEIYDYNGESRSTDLGLSRLMYRDAKRKITLAGKLWTRQSRNYINDIEIPNQRRIMSGWLASLEHKEYIGPAILNTGLTYKRGTGANDSLRAPEEQLSEGTSRMKLVTADVGLYWPFQIKQQSLSYNTSLRLQWNGTPLIPQDRVSIGGRYTVRGFDGSMSLMGDRGWYWRNDVSWQYWGNHQIYIGADVGHVSGRSAEYQVGRTLAGGVIGLKGMIKAGGDFSYDLFVGQPFHQPRRFQTAKTAAGFSVNYTF